MRSPRTAHFFAGEGDGRKTFAISSTRSFTSLARETAATTSPWSNFDTASAHPWFADSRLACAVETVAWSRPAGRVVAEASFARRRSRASSLPGRPSFSCAERRHQLILLLAGRLDGGLDSAQERLAGSEGALVVALVEGRLRAGKGVAEGLELVGDVPLEVGLGLVEGGARGGDRLVGGALAARQRQGSGHGNGKKIRERGRRFAPWSFAPWGSPEPPGP